jgi:Uma2 family endonuclease
VKTKETDMATVLRIGPADHGRPMGFDEYMAGDYEEGYQYELIDGRLYVSPMPNLPYDCLEQWLYFQLRLYAHNNSSVINHVTNKARVFVPGRSDTTCPEPDVAAYRNFPKQLPLEERRWQDVSPVLVAEVLSADDPDKDLVRNVELYLQVPSIREYWIIDPRESADFPRLIVHRRYRGAWSIREYAAGMTYTTKLLPNFGLPIDPRSE